MKNVIEKEYCTGCGLCTTVCPQNCISLQPDELDALYPRIETTRCISCGLCEKLCPSRKETIQAFAHPQKLMAAWNKNTSDRKNAASGGIASGFYHAALKNGWWVTGVSLEPSFCARMKMCNEEDVVEQFKNSKYVFSSAQDIYEQVRKKLALGERVLFIGLPCQVAAMKRYLSYCSCSGEKLVVIDLICHGVAPAEYLQQHVQTIAKKKKELINTISFRNPQFGTQHYIFSLFTREKCVYNKNVKSHDTYQVGYHKALIYRENCYNCIYARAERVSDITIGDFSGLGRFAPYSGEKTKVSSVLINTDVGEQFWNDVQDLFVSEVRPMEEALKIEGQLQHPSIKHSGRRTFEKQYKKHQSFEKAVLKAATRDIFVGWWYDKLHVRQLKNWLRRIIKR